MALEMTAVKIVCPNCSTAYDVSAASLGSDGRSVRCVRCREVWFAAAPVPADADGIDAEWARPPDPAPLPEVEDADYPARGTTDDNWSAVESGWDDPPKSDMAEQGSPPLAPDSENHSSIEEPEAPKDVESVAARRVGRRGFSYRLALSRHGPATALLVLIAVNTSLIAWRESIVRALPQTGSLYALIGLPVNLRGLVIDGVTTSHEAHEGVPVLVVEGTVKNISKRALEIPRIRLSLRNRAGAEIYAWTSMPPRTILNTGEEYSIRSRLASPPAEGRDLVVRFFHRRDVAAGVN